MPNLANASEKLAKLVSGYRKVSGTEKIAPFLDIKANYSQSFNCFLKGILALVEEIKN